MPIPRKTPQRIVEPDGTVHEGWFATPFVDANLEQAPVIPEVPGRIGRLLRRVARRTRLKQWQYTNVVTPRHFLAAAVIDAGYLGVVFVYLVDRQTRQVHEYGTLTPMRRGVRVAANSVAGVTRADVEGFGTVCFTNDAARRRRSVAIDVAATAQHPALRASFVIEEGHDMPMVAVDRLGPRRWLYTHKCYGLRAEGHLSLGSEVFAAEPGTALAGLDWNRGYRRYDTFWNWAAASGFDTEGRRMGFTMTARKPKLGHGPTEGTGSTEEGYATDCAVWADGAMMLVRGVRFDYDPDHVLGPWRVTDADGCLELAFEPWGERVEDIDFGLIVSRFHQPYGVFRGTIQLPTGDVVAFDDVFGVTEQHHARW